MFSYKTSAVVHILVIMFLSHFVLAAPNVRNLQARYDAQQNAIFITWNSPQPRDDLQYQIQYRIANRDPPENRWQYKRVQTTEGRLDLPGLRDGDEVDVEVKSELDGANHGQPLTINIVKHTQTEGIESNEDDELMPPLNFEATILDPNSVKLDWRPDERQRGHTFYVVNIKQLTTNNGNQNPLRQQIRADGTTFTLNNLVAGEKYEITIRTATSPEHTSSTAAIVEISLPKDEEYYEVGNLLVSSKFRVNGTGTVNLTWEVPQAVRERVLGYGIEYSLANTNNWQSLQVNSESPTTILEHLQSDTEYVLKIKTRFRNNVETESGEFRFRTPKVYPNPISKVDVIYSSDTNDVRVQWTLENFVRSEEVVGYDVYVNENQNAPESHWRHIPVHSADTSTNLNGLTTSTTYFVKIHVRKHNGDILKSSIIYKFTTLNEYPRTTQLFPRSVEVHGPKTFSYRNFDSSTEIRWKFAPDISNTADEARIYYTTDTEEEDLNSTVWSHVDVELEHNTEHVFRLNDLQSDSVYFIKVVPKINGQLNLDFAESFSIKTAPATSVKRRKRHHPHHRRHVEDMSPFVVITACIKHSKKHQCAQNQHCVMVEDNVGWCLDTNTMSKISNHQKADQDLN
ncbi:Collagen alpha-1(XX) chain [Aphelenchoides besseyi]|nr:Collagen alpha-1(XX) chain [Aphelenchoides besseyi]